MCYSPPVNVKVASVIHESPLSRTWARGRVRETTMAFTIGSVCNRHDRRATGIKHKPCLEKAATIHVSGSAEYCASARKRCGPTVTCTGRVRRWHNSGGTSILRSLRIRTGSLSKPESLMVADGIIPSASLSLTTTGCVCLRRCRAAAVARSCTRDHSAFPPTVPSIPPCGPAR